MAMQAFDTDSEYMNNLLVNFHRQANDKSTIIKSLAKILDNLNYMHPFRDGNGRTLRLLLNLELMKQGFPPIIIKVENRLDYYTALDNANTRKEYDEFIQLVAIEVEDSLDLYLSAI